MSLLEETYSKKVGSFQAELLNPQLNKTDCLAKFRIKTNTHLKGLSIVISLLMLLGFFEVGFSQTISNINQLTVVTTLLGINDKTGLSAITIKANNYTKTAILNTTDLDYKDQYHDGIVESWNSFHNVTIIPGTEFKVCAIVFDTLNIVCHTGYKSPSERAESATLMLDVKNNTIVS